MNGAKAMFVTANVCSDWMVRNIVGILRSRSFSLGVAAILAVSLVACATQGPQRLPRERFDYSEAISTSSKEQMLANIVRFRYLDFPVFMAVNSVITSYSYEGSVGVTGTTGLPETLGDDAFTAEGNLAYAERPTITYAPLSGEDFTRRLMTPIPIEAIFSLGQTGWDVELLLLTGISRINDVENLPFDVDLLADTNEGQQRSKREIAQLQRFRRVVDLFLSLSEQDVIELQKPDDESEQDLLVFDDDVADELQPAVAEFKELLDLAPDRNSFRVTARLTRRKADEIVIHSRSLLAIMSFLSKGVEVPDPHLSQGWVQAFSLPEDSGGRDILPLRVRTQARRPDDAFCAVLYQNHWFYVEQADQTSKAVFQMLLALFELQAPTGGAVAPVLTLPAGR